MTAVDVKGLEAAISAQQELVERQGDVVRSLKAEVKEGKVLKHEVDAAIEKLKGLKIELDGKLKEFQVRETRSGRGGRYGGVRRGAGGCRGRPPSHQPRPWGSRLRPSSIPAHALTRSHNTTLPPSFIHSLAGCHREILFERQRVVPGGAGQCAGAQNVLRPRV